MLTVLFIVIAAVAILMALRRGGSPRGAFDLGRERLRDAAHKPAMVAPFYVAVGAFIALGLVTGSGNWKAALFAFAFVSAFLTLMLWVARR